MTLTVPGVALGMFAMGAALVAQPPAAIQGPPMPPLTLTVGPTTRLLVVAAHPDDETLGAGGLIRRVTDHGGAVRVVWMTSGDGFPEGVETEAGISHPTTGDYRSYGGLREFEARAAVESLGVNRDSLSFLGFPDEGMCELASTNLSATAHAFTSPYTHRFSPPPAEQLIRGVRYRGTDVRREFERLVVEFSPTVIVIPHPQDAHPDHCSTHMFVSAALDAVRAAGHPVPRVLHYLIHYRQWPLSADAGTGSELQPPAGFPAGEGRWVSLALTPDEAAAKKNALLIYRSQMLVIGRFMLAFGRRNELFIEGEPAALPQCWCNGENVATILSPSSRPRHPGAP